MTAYAQWLRYCRLVVAVDGRNEEALDLSAFRVKFHIGQASVGKPCTAEITVYNVAESTVKRIATPTNQVVSGRRPHVILEAGYEGSHSVIFEGDLYWKSTGRENGTDTFMRLIAGTGDRAHRYAVVNASIPRGATQEEVFSIVAQSMASEGVQVANKPRLMATQLPRGKVLYQMSSDAMQHLADTNEFEWGYTSSGLVAIRKDRSYDPNEAVIVLNAKTGLIERPMLTVDGVSAKCLLQPRIDIGTLVRIDNASIQRDSYDTSYKADVQKNEATTDSMTSADGLYRVISREHVGDTRGNDWYTTIICEGVNAAVSPMTPTVMTNMPNF